jgi:hypothetical protein
MFLVPTFLPDMTQQIHSLRASGVISFHTASAVGMEAIDFKKSAGILCKLPVEISFFDIRLFYLFLTSLKTKNNA